MTVIMRMWRTRRRADRFWSIMNTLGMVVRRGVVRGAGIRVLPLMSGSVMW